MTTQTRPTVLIAGIGNIFLGDDGFGCEVIRSLRIHCFPETVKVIDYGIRGLDLVYALHEPYETVILVDAITRGGAPGTVYLLQPIKNEDLRDSTLLDPHSMDPAHVLAMARSLGDVAAEIFIVGCEPEDFGDGLVGRIGLSSALAASIPETLKTIVELVARVHTTTSLSRS